MSDSTSYTQSLTHMVKGNLGTGILAMPASFAHAGLVFGCLGLPFLCIVSTYCVHLLVQSAKKLQGVSKEAEKLDYGDLAKYSFRYGPDWIQPWSNLMCAFVDGCLLVSQLGVCCVYLVFVVDNITTILSSYHIQLAQSYIFIGILPIALLLSYIKTLKRLSIASACANFLQMGGIIIIIEYLLRDISETDLSKRDLIQPVQEVALGFGSAMFAFEGISVVLPIYARIKHSDRMQGSTGVINVSYGILLFLYFCMGIFGYLKFGHEAKGSITLNLPPEPLYDAVRAMFTVSVFLTYPLQFYVPNEIVWTWVRKNLLLKSRAAKVSVSTFEVVVPHLDTGNEKVPYLPDGKSLGHGHQNLFNCSENNINQFTNKEKPQIMDISPRLSESSNLDQLPSHEHIDKYDYACRTALVLATFMLAISVPKLNLLMDLIGSMTGAILSIILPSIIYIICYSDESLIGGKMIVNFLVLIFGIVATSLGSVFSLQSILQSFVQ